MKISRFDYKRQKELLDCYIGEEIIYNNEKYKIVKIISGDIQVMGVDYKIDTIWTVRVLSQNNKIKEVPIDNIFKVCYPHLCWKEVEF